MCGYNNGGSNTKSTIYSGYVKMPGSGGGATHIATRSGLLYTLENYKSDVLIVAGGGGGSGYVGGVPAITYSGTYYTPGMVNGNRAGHGMARIQLKKIQSNLKFNNITMEKVYFNNTKIEKVIYNGSTVYG